MANRYFVYGTSSCPFCILALEKLSSMNLENIFFNLEHDPAYMKEVKEFYDHGTVPIVLQNDLTTGMTSFVGGSDDLMELLDD